MVKSTKIRKEDVGIWLGPIILPNSRGNTNTVKVNIGATATVVSTAGGVINNVYSSDPITSSGWANNSAVWDEYRVLGFKISFYPHDRYAPGILTVTRPMAIVSDHNGNAAITSWNEALTYESGYKMGNSGDPWSKEIRMKDLGEGVFINTASSPANAYYVKLYGDTVTASTTYGRVIQTYLVEFRGRGI